MQAPGGLSFSNVIESFGHVVMQPTELNSIRLGDKDPLGDVIEKIASEENPHELPMKYEMLKEYIESCSAQAKHQLYGMLFGFFYYTVNRLLETRVEGKIIMEFFQRHGNEHHNFHKAEIEKLFTYARSQRVAPNVKFTHKLTRVCHDMLVAFLDQNNMPFFLKVLNNNFQINIVSMETVQSRPDTISEFIVVIDTAPQKIIKPNITLNQENVIDLANARLSKMDKDIMPLEIYDDSTEDRTSSIFPLPRPRLDQILVTMQNIQQMARLNKGELPSCAYFTFPQHDTAYDINCDGTLIAQVSNQGYSRLFSTSIKTDIDDLPLFSSVTAPNEFQCQSLFYNHLLVPRPLVKQYKDGQRIATTFSRYLIGPRSYFARFSPESRFLLTGANNSFRLWTCEESGAFSQVTTPSGINWCGDWNPFGYYFAVGSDDGLTTMWSVDSGRPLRAFAAHSEAVTDVKFHPNGTLLCTCSYDRKIHLSDIKNAQTVRQFVSNAVPRCLEFTRNGKIIVTGDDSGTITTYDIKDDTKLGAVRGHEGGVRDIAISVEGTIVATVGNDGEILLWDTGTLCSSAAAQAKPLKRLQAKAAETRRIKFSTRNLLFAIGSSCEPKEIKK